MIIGNVEQYKTEAQALRASEGIRMRVNQAGPHPQPTSFAALVDRFILEEIANKKPIGIETQIEEGGLAYSTTISYLSMLNTHIKPRWKDYLVSNVKPALVQEWLNEKRAAPKYKGHIKALMRRLFEKAMLWELLPLQRNPMELVEVRGISRRQRRPRILTLEEFIALIMLLHEPYSHDGCRRSVHWIAGQRDPGASLVQDQLRESHDGRQTGSGKWPSQRTQDRLLGRRTPSRSRLRYGPASLESPVSFFGRKLVIS